MAIVRVAPDCDASDKEKKTRVARWCRCLCHLCCTCMTFNTDTPSHPIVQLKRPGIASQTWGNWLITSRLRLFATQGVELTILSCTILAGSHFAISSDQLCSFTLCYLTINTVQGPTYELLHFR